MTAATGHGGGAAAAVRGAGAPPVPELVSPTNGAGLTAAAAGEFVGGVAVPPGLPPGCALLGDGERLWPVVAGIAYLRPDDALRAVVVDRLARGDDAAALRLLLADQDRFAPTPPPGGHALDRLLADDPARGGPGRLTLRTAMRLLGFGPVGDYFAYRWLSPTYLSGLVLLGRAAAAGRPVVEVACGIGHFLRALERRGFATAGVDVVFAKLYLARRFLDVRGPLACGDVEAGPVLAPGRDARTAFCHDAFYFFARKDAALAHLRALAGPTGAVAVGHVHTRGDAHAAGFPEAVDGYRARLPAGSTLLDDAALPGVWYGRTGFPGEEAGGGAAAVAWVEGTTRDRPLDWLAPAREPGAALRRNPLLTPRGVAWPSASWRAEYEADATAARLGGAHLARLASRVDDGDPDRALPPRPARERALRDRLLVDLPPRW